MKKSLYYSGNLNELGLLMARPFCSHTLPSSPLLNFWLNILYLLAQLLCSFCLNLLALIHMTVPQSHLAKILSLRVLLGLDLIFNFQVQLTLGLNCIGI